ncbi:MAG: hypothetical protein KTR31_07760 [Myxococcales bacterium]|nr:hypothetical protein [Myxococcales bacterium]
MWMMWAAVSAAEPVEPPVTARVEMREHEADALAAVRAFVADDLRGIRRSGRRLARPDPTRGLPPAVLPLLESIRRIGDLLSETSQARDAAGPLASLAGTCGACHAITGVTAVAHPAQTSLERSFLAVALRDESLWRDAPDEPATSSWPLRERALRQRLERLP